MIHAALVLATMIFAPFEEVEAGLAGSEAEGVSIERGFASNENQGVNVPVGDLFFTADLRHLFLDPAKGERQDRGVTFRHDGGASYSGGFVHDQQPDSGAVLFGGGFRF